MMSTGAVRKLRDLVFAALLSAGMIAPLNGQSVDSTRAVLRLPQPATFAVGARGEWTAPGITIGVPSGFGADFGDAFVAAGFQASTRLGSHDGGIAAGFGIGDAQRLVGLEVTATSYGTIRSCCRGGLSTKLHRVVGGNTSVAVGFENVYWWGQMGVDDDDSSDAGRSLYAVATTIFPLREQPTGFLGSAAVTAGLGNGRFRREDDILAYRERVNPFFSLGLRLAEQGSLITSWTGQDLVAGISVVPIRGLPLFITPAAADLTTKPRFIIGVGYGINYSSIF